MKKPLKKSLKNLMMTVALVASLNAVAAAPTGASDSWAKIFADNSLLVSTPFSGTFGPLGIFNACATDKEFKAISPVSACVEYKYVPAHGEVDSPSHYECVKSELQIPSMPRTSTQHVCVEQNTSEAHYPDCLRWADVTTTLPTQMQIEVMYSRGEAYANTAFFKEFTVPSCPQ